MLNDLKILVDTIRDAVSGFANFRSKKARSQAILELLCIYFLLLDVVEEGRDLLRAVGSDPRTTLLRAPEIERAAIPLAWHHALCRQASRLYTLGGRLLGQDALSVFDPMLKARLERIVSSKFRRVRSLHGIGAGLVMYSMFGDAKDEKWSRDVILSMYPAKTRAIIDLRASRCELNSLSAALKRFRVVCTGLATSDEILAVSKKARDLTSYEKPSR